MAEILTNHFQSYDYIPQGICVLDSQCNIIGWNKVLESWSHLSFERVANKNIFDLFSNLHKSFYRDRFQQVLAGGPPALFSPEIHKYIVPCELPNQQYRIQDGNLVGFDLGGHGRIGVLSLSDVTATFVRVRELRRLNKLKDKFLSVCSHDLKTPLNVILGFCQLLEFDSSLAPRHRDDLGQIKKAAELLLTLVNDLLDVSKLQHGKSSSKFGPLIMGSIVRASMEMAKILANRKQIKLKFEDDTVSGGAVSGNLLGLSRVVNNLLSNAIKFTPVGGVITLQIQSQEISRQNRVILTISDSGIGIPKEKMDKLFDDFTSVSQTGTAGERGTGLGLSIVKSIIDQHGGTIEVESIVDKGSSFRIILPERNLSDLERAQIGVDPSHVAKKPLGTSKGGAKKILVIDDDESSRALVRAFLSKTPHTLELVGSGHDGIGKVMSKSYDLIILDMEMPILNGYRTAKVIRNWEKQRSLTPMPIIACTSHDRDNFLEQAKESGCTDYIQKPLSRDKLIEMIDNY